MWNVQTESQWEFERNFNYLSYDALQLFFLKFPVLRLLYQFHSHALHEFFFFFLFLFYHLRLIDAIWIFFLFNSLSLWSGDGTLSVCNLRRNKVSYPCGVSELQLFNDKKLKLLNIRFWPLFIVLLIGPSSVWVFWRWAIVCCYNEGILLLVSLS